MELQVWLVVEEDTEHSREEQEFKETHHEQYGPSLLSVSLVSGAVYSYSDILTSPYFYSVIFTPFLILTRLQ